MCKTNLMSYFSFCGSKFEFYKKLICGKIAKKIKWFEILKWVVLSNMVFLVIKFIGSDIVGLSSS